MERIYGTATRDWVCMTITARATCASVAVTASLAVAWGVCQIGGALRGQESSAAPREASAQAVREADSLDLSFADVTVRPAALIEAAQPPRPTVVKPAESNEPEHMRVGQANQAQPNAKITLGAPSDEPISGGTQFVIRGIAAPPKAGALEAPGRGIVKRKTNFATPGIAAAPVPGSAAHDERPSDQIDQEAPQVVAKPSHTAKQHVPAKQHVAAKPEATAKTQITSDPKSTDRVAEQSPAPAKHDPATPSQSRLKVAQKSPAATAKTVPEAIEPTAPRQTASRPRSEATAKIAAVPPAESRLKISARPPVKVEPHKPAIKVQAPASPPLLAAKEPAPAAVHPEPAPVVEKTEPLADVAVEKSTPAVESVVEAEPVPTELATPQASQSAAVPCTHQSSAEPAETRREVAQREIVQVEPSAPAAAPEPVVHQPAIKSEPVVAAPAIQAAPRAVEREVQRELAKVDAPAAPEVMPEDSAGRRGRRTESGSNPVAVGSHGGQESGACGRGEAS